MGFLIRNSQGLVIAAQSMKLHEGSDSVQRHAWAILHAIQFAFVIGIRCVEMELGSISAAISEYIIMVQ